MREVIDLSRQFREFRRCEEIVRRRRGRRRRRRERKKEAAKEEKPRREGARERSCADRKHVYVLRE